MPSNVNRAPSTSSRYAGTVPLVDKLPDQDLDIEWGVVPAPIVDAIQLLTEVGADAASSISAIEWPPAPSSVQDQLRGVVEGAHRSARAGRELRSLLTAYAHRFHQPRPTMAALAREQETTPQGIPRRYRDSHVRAIAELLSQHPNIDTIRAGFPSLTVAALSRVRGPVGDAAQELAPTA